jgi:hypothetical protein
MPNVALACGLSRKTAKGVRATYDCWCRQRQLSVVPAPPLIIRLSIWARQGGLRWFFSTVKLLSPPGPVARIPTRGGLRPHELAVSL